MDTSAENTQPHDAPAAGQENDKVTFHLGMCYRLLDNRIASPFGTTRADVRLWQEQLEKAVTDFLTRAAWADWTIQRSDHADPNAKYSNRIDFTSLVSLRAEGLPQNGFHEFDIVDADGNRVYFDSFLTDWEDGEELLDEAYRRLWNAVDLLDAIFLAGVHGCDDANREQRTVRFTGCPTSFRLPENTVVQIIPVMRALQRFQEQLQRLPAFELQLFESSDFIITSFWFDTMYRGCDELNRFLHAYTPKRK